MHDRSNNARLRISGNRGDLVTSSNPLPVSNSSTGTQRTILSRYLDTNGDGSGTKNANGNYSGGQEIFYIQPPAGSVFRITRMLVAIEDTTGALWQDYGNITSGITNGVAVRVQDDSGTLVDLTDAEPVKSNVDGGSHCYDAELKTAGAGNDFVQARWTFANSGQMIRLVGDDNGRLEVTLDDNLTGLIGHYFKINGYIE